MLDMNHLKLFAQLITPNGWNQIGILIGIASFISGAGMVWWHMRQQVEEQAQDHELCCQRQAEQYRILADQMPQLVWISQATGTINYINQRWCDYTGLSLTEIQAHGWYQLVHPEDQSALLAAWRNCVAQCHPLEMQYRLRRGDGIYRWHLGRAVPLCEPTGQVLWLGTCTDIDDQKCIEAELNRRCQSLAAECDRLEVLERQARAEAEATNRIKDEFLMVLSHELRSPLNPILGWSKLLQTHQLHPATVNRALETIERNAKLQTQLIEDLLDLSQMLQGNVRLLPHAVHLADSIMNVLESVQLSANAKSIQIHTTIDPTVGAVWGDRDRLHQVLWHVLTNAVKFTSLGGTITISLLRVHEYAQIQVQDSGQGIDVNFLPYVFDSFRQADGSTTRSFGGLGLGMAIARHLVELHGGMISVDSAGIGCGSTFTIQLPLIRPLLPPPSASVAVASIPQGVTLPVLAVESESTTSYSSFHGSAPVQ